MISRVIFLLFTIAFIAYTWFYTSQAKSQQQIIVGGGNNNSKTVTTRYAVNDTANKGIICCHAEWKTAKVTVEQGGKVTDTENVQTTTADAKAPGYSDQVAAYKEVFCGENSTDDKRTGLPAGEGARNRFENIIDTVDAEGKMQPGYLCDCEFTQSWN